MQQFTVREHIVLAREMVAANVAHVRFDTHMPVLVRYQIAIGLELFTTQTARIQRNTQMGQHMHAYKAPVLGSVVALVAFENLCVLGTSMHALHVFADCRLTFELGFADGTGEVSSGAVDHKVVLQHVTTPETFDAKRAPK